MKRTAVGIPGSKKPRRRSSAKPDTGNTMLERGGDELINKISSLVELSDSVNEAADALGVDSTAIYDWIKRGEGHLQLGKTGTIFARFANRIKKARANFVLGNLNIIRRAAMGSPAKPPQYAGKGKQRVLVTPGEPAERKQWQAAAWTLERRRAAFRLKDTPGAQGGAGPAEIRFIAEAPRREAAPRSGSKAAAAPEPETPILHTPAEDDDD